MADPLPSPSTTVRRIVGRPKTAIDLRELQANARAASALLTAMANENRLLLLCRISAGDLTVTELVAETDLTQSAVSQHLALLRRLGIVSSRRCGKAAYYRIASSQAKAILETLYAQFGRQSRQSSHSVR